MKNDVGTLFTEVSCEKLDAMVRLLANCMERLSDEQVWERGGEHENSVGNLVLHLEGNIQQWILHGIGDERDMRERDAEFSTRGGMSRAELMERFRAMVAKARTVIAATPTERMFERIAPQPGRADSSVLGAIYMVVGHVQQHVGQIIVLTKQMVGTDLDLTIPRAR